jgi:hypothetical protein
MRKTLMKQGRQLQKMTQFHVDIKYGYEPRHMAFAVEKSYPRIINPNFMQMVAKRLEGAGNTVIDGVVSAVYTDSPSGEGFVEVTANAADGAVGKKTIIPYSKLVLSLGNQDIVGEDSKPLVDSVYSRRVSGLGLVYLKKGQKMPSSWMVGPRNYVTNVAGPVRVTRDKEQYNCHLVRLTSGACITPQGAGENSSNYDAVVANGLVTAARRWLSCDMEVISMWGTNSRLTEFGEMHWFQPAHIGAAEAAAGSLMLKDLGTARPDEAVGGGIFVQLGGGAGAIAQGASRPPVARKNLAAVFPKPQPK